MRKASSLSDSEVDPNHYSTGSTGSSDSLITAQYER